LAEDGRSVAVIAERLKRSSSAVRKRAKKLGVMVELRLKAKK
jgi:DNA-binding Lrp family transcriptional regulator